MCKHSYHFLSTQECTRTCNKQIKSQSAKIWHVAILSHTRGLDNNGYFIHKLPFSYSSIKSCNKTIVWNRWWDQILYCDHSMESSRRDDSNEWPQYKNILLLKEIYQKVVSRTHPYLESCSRKSCALCFACITHSRSTAYLWQNYTITQKMRNGFGFLSIFGCE